MIENFNMYMFSKRYKNRAWFIKVTAKIKCYKESILTVCFAVLQ